MILVVVMVSHGFRQVNRYMGDWMVDVSVY